LSLLYLHLQLVLRIKVSKVHGISRSVCVCLHGFKWHQRLLVMCIIILTYLLMRQERQGNHLVDNPKKIFFLIIYNHCCGSGSVTGSIQIRKDHKI